MKTLGFTGRVLLARDKRGRIQNAILPHEIMQLPAENAAELQRASSHVVDLTLSPIKAPYGAIVPVPLLGRLWRVVK